jgi:hypothetical protein
MLPGDQEWLERWLQHRRERMRAISYAAPAISSKSPTN